MSRDFGRKMWDVIHGVAAGYPVNEDMSRKEKEAWANKYLVFYQTLQYVLPKQAWRDTMFYVMTTGPGKLGEAEMRRINEAKNPKKALSRKLFQLHDAVRERLRQPVHKGCYDTWYARYAGTSAGTAGRKSAVIDAGGASMLRALLEVRADPMDVFLRERIPGYQSIKLHRKAELRDMYLQEGAEWWWNKLASSYEKETPAKQRELVKSAFLARFQRGRNVPVNVAKDLLAVLPKLR